MSATEAPTLDVTDVGFADAHIECCEHERFVCGAPFHPESVATDDDEPCATCIERLDRNVCGAPHQHCPLSRKICTGTPR